MSSKSNYGNEKYKEILLANGIHDPVEAVEIETVNMSGDGFASLVETVTVKFKDVNQPPLLFFVKKQVENEEYANQLKEVRMYERESEFFNALLPDLVKFAQQKPTYDGFLDTAVVRCYYADGDLLVLENLKEKGYTILDRKTPHDLTQAKLSLDGIAKIHAATYAFIDNIGLEEFKARYPCMHKNTTFSTAGTRATGPWIQMPVDGAIKVLKAKPTPGSDKVLEYFQQYEEDAFKEILPLYDLSTPSCAIVLNHGDYWNSNIMFKLDLETQIVKDCVIIDWQTCHLGSPVLDLQFYLFFVVENDIRRKELLDLLKFYYERFQHYALQLEQETLFSFQEIEEEFRRKCTVGFIYAMYNIFGMEALSEVGDIGNEEGDALKNLAATMSNGLDNLMDKKGEHYSKEIVKGYEEFQKLQSGL